MSICQGINDIIDQHLDIFHIGKPPHYGHSTSCDALQTPPARLNTEAMIGEILLRIESNWKQSARYPTLISRENWRFKKQLLVSKTNQSPEKQLEKKITRITDENWINQVPTASGLYDAHHDKLRNIDLVHRLAPKRYEFIELKVNSDTPLKAAIEALICGVLYIVARLHYADQYKETPELLQAEQIQLCVLAPHAYYERYSLPWLPIALNPGLQAVLAQRRLDLKMDFQFKVFPFDFKINGEESELLNSLDQIAIISMRSP